MKSMKGLGLVRASIVIVSILGITTVGLAQETHRDVHTIIDAGTSADGTSQIQKEVVEECIMKLPTLDDLQPITDATSKFLKAINGDKDRNESTRTYSAVIELTYVVYEKTLLVVTTNSVERSEPVFREVDGRFDQTARFESNSENGDMFHGRDLAKEYFFSTEQGAIDDAKRRAKAWLEQKRTVMCKR
jgi:hypothetical protein